VADAYAEEIESLRPPHRDLRPGDLVAAWYGRDRFTLVMIIREVSDISAYTSSYTVLTSKGTLDILSFYKRPRYCIMRPQRLKR
jgi:hypothetical protein